MIYFLDGIKSSTFSRTSSHVYNMKYIKVRLDALGAIQYSLHVASKYASTLENK